MVLARAPATVRLLRLEQAARRRADIDGCVPAEVGSEARRAARLGSGDEREAIGTRQPACRRGRQPVQRGARALTYLGRNLRMPRVREERQPSDGAAALRERGGQRTDALAERGDPPEAGDDDRRRHGYGRAVRTRSPTPRAPAG